jgi:hypothetical protein
MTNLPEIAKAASEMMGHRSERRLPNLLVAQAHHEAAYVIEVKTRGFHQDQDPTPGSIKRSERFVAQAFARMLLSTLIQWPRELSSRPR